MSPTPQIFQRGALSPVSRVLQSGRVWAIQGVGTILWLALARTCLLIGTDGAWRLAASIVLAIFLSYLAAFLQRTALRVYRRERLRELALDRQRKSRPLQPQEWILDAATVFVMFVALVGLVIAIPDVLPDLLKSELTTAILAWFFLIVFWLPIAAAALLGERRMWGAAARAWRLPKYWLGTLACLAVWQLVLGQLLQSEVVHWVEGATNLGAAAFGLLLAAYGIALGAWLVILALAEECISRPEPRSLDDTWD